MRQIRREDLNRQGVQSTDIWTKTRFCSRLIRTIDKQSLLQLRLRPWPTPGSPGAGTLSQVGCSETFGPSNTTLCHASRLRRVGDWIGPFDWGSSKPFSVGWWAESDGSDVEIPGRGPSINGEGRLVSVQ